MANREIPMNCLGEETRCLVYSGDPILSLDIKTGDSLEFVISQLASTSPEVVEQAGIYINTYNIPVLSSCAIQLVQSAFNYTITASTAGILFSWNIPNVLPAGFGFTSTDVSVIADGVVSNSSSRSSSLNISSMKLPATVEVNQLVNTPCGDVMLSKTIPITASLRGSYVGVFEVKDLNNTPSQVTIQEAISMALAVGIQNQQQLEDFRASQNTTDYDVLQQRIVDLENVDPDTTVTYVDQGVEQTKELSVVITDLYSLLRADIASLKTLQNDFDALKVQVSNLS